MDSGICHCHQPILLPLDHVLPHQSLDSYRGKFLPIIPPECKLSDKYFLVTL